MAIAVLGILEERVVVYRTRNELEIAEAKENKAYIVDVGGIYYPAMDYFDHHQRSFAETRADGTKYAAAGLLWRAYGVDACVEVTACTLEQAEEAAARVDEMLIKDIDAADNGQLDSDGTGMSLYGALGVLNPTWEEPEENDQYFEDACRVAYSVLTHTIMSCVAAIRGRDTVKAAIAKSENRVMILPCYIDGWIDVVLASEDPKAKDILYGVFKTSGGDWKVQALPPEGNPMAQRKPLPEAWRGRRGLDFVVATGVSGATFCHLSGFMCGADSLPGALRLAALAVEATE